VLTHSCDQALNQSKSLPYLLLAPAGIFISAVILYPILYGVYLSFTDQGLPGSPTEIVGLSNFSNLLNDALFHGIAGNTVRWVVVTVMSVMVLGFCLALLLNRPFPGQPFARGLLLIPWTLPTVAIAIVFQWLYDPQVGTLNQVVTSLGWPRLQIIGDLQVALNWVAIPVIWRFYPFVMLMLLAGLQSINQEYYEAAAIDGANAWERFRQITFPLIRPILLLVAILQFIWLFNHVDIIWLMTQGGPANSTHTLATYAFYLAYKKFDYAEASAIGVIMLLILLISAIAYLRMQERIETEL